MVRTSDLERRNSSYFAFFFPPNSIALLVNYVTVVEDRPNVREIMSLSFSLPVLAITNQPCRLQRGLSATAELLVYYVTSVHW